MNVLVVGAAGKTGKAIVEQAITAGHNVTAFVHSAQTDLPAGIRVLVGDAREPFSIDQAVQGQDAVVDALGGHLPFLKTDLETTAAENLIRAMGQAGVRRLIVLSTIGEGDSIRNVHDFYRKYFMSTVLRGVMADKAGMESVVEQSTLDWVIIRPAGLRDGDPEGLHVVTPESDEKVRFISRDDVARFAVEQLTSDQYLYRAVGIAGPHDED